MYIYYGWCIMWFPFTHRDAEGPERSMQYAHTVRIRDPTGPSFPNGLVGSIRGMVEGLLRA